MSRLWRRLRWLLPPAYWPHWAPREWVRMFIIRRLDRRRDTCWSDLVNWAVGKDEPWIADRGLVPGDPYYDGVAKCRQLARDVGHCYCGKFATPRHQVAGTRFLVTHEWTAEDRADDVPRLELGPAAREEEV